MAYPVIPIGDATELGASARPDVGAYDAETLARSRAAAAARAAAPAAADAAAVAPAVNNGLRGSIGRVLANARPIARVAGNIGKVAGVAGLGATTAAETAGTDTADYEKRFGFQPNDSDGVTGLARDIGVRALGAASDLGSTLTGGLSSKLYRDKQDAAPAAAPAVSPLPGADYGHEGLREPAAPPAPPEDFQRINRPGQSPLFTNVADQSGFTNHPGTVSTINQPGDGSPSSAERTQALLREAASMRENRLAEQGLRDRGDADYYTTGQGSKGGALAAGFSGRTINDRSRPAGAAGGLSAGFQANLAEKQADRTQQAQIAANRDRTERDIAGNANQVSMRGQDVQQYGHELSAKVSREAGRREEMRANRSYELDVAKYGTEVAEKNRVASEASQAASQKHIEDTLRTTNEKGESVPDQAKIADYNRAVTATLPALISALQSSSKPGAAEKARELQQRGVAALGPEGHDDLLALYDRRQRVAQAHGTFTPGSANFRHSDNLLDYQQAEGSAGVQHNLLTPNKIALRGGSTVAPNDLRYESGPANAVLPDVGKISTSRYNRGLRQP